MTQQGTLYIISAPSGAGKTSLVKALLPQLSETRLSISCTTRPARAGEVDGVNYFFVDEAKFAQMVATESFMEYATVFGYHYGTSHDWVEQTLAQGTDVILEIDWQGARQCRMFHPDSLLIFILPPSIAVLQQRLEARRLDSPEVIKRRLSEAAKEMSHSHEYDYIVINDDFSQALSELQAIFVANSLKTQRQLAKNRSILDKILL
jgi:guanylate kinase